MLVAEACSTSGVSCPEDAATLRGADLLTAVAAPTSGFPPGVVNWTCDAFPNDNMPSDSLIVALIALAVAIPVTVFLSGLFEIANDSDAPESWLRYTGVVRMLCGKLAHRRWHYTGPLGQPNRFVRWYVRCGDAPMAETLMNLLHSARAALTGAPTPWAPDEQHESKADIDEAKHARGIKMQSTIRALMGVGDNPPIAEAEDERARKTIRLLLGIDDSLHAAEAAETEDERARKAIQMLMDNDDHGAEAVEAAETEDDRARKTIRLLMGADDLDDRLPPAPAATTDDPDLEFTFDWTMYSHDMSGSPTHGDADSLNQKHSQEEEAKELRRSKRQLTVLGLFGILLIWACFAWFIFTYGLLIFELLGRDAEQSFIRSWGVSYGVGAASEWRDLLRQAVISLLVLAIAERLHLTRPVAWLEDHIDYMSTAALLLEHGGLSYFLELRLFFTFRRRLVD